MFSQHSLYKRWNKRKQKRQTCLAGLFKCPNTYSICYRPFPLTHFLSSFTLCFSFPFLHFLALNVYCIDAKYITHNCPHYEREHKEMQINILTFTLCSSTLVLKVRIRMHITYFSFKQYTIKCASYTQTHRKSNGVILDRFSSPS